MIEIQELMSGTLTLRNEPARVSVRAGVRVVRRVLLFSVASLLGATPVLAQASPGTTGSESQSSVRQAATTEEPSADGDHGGATDTGTGLVEEYFFTESAFTQEKGEVQMTSGLTLTRGASGFWSLPLSVEYGITDRLQVGIAVPLLSRVTGPDAHVRTADGVEVEVLYGLRRDADSLAVSIGVATEVEAGDDEDDSRSVEFEPFLCLARRLGRVEVQANLGASLGDDHSFVFSVAAAVPVRDWRFMAEVGGDSGRAGRLLLVPGLARRLPGGAEISIGFPIAGGHGFHPAGVVVRTTFEF